MYPPDPSSVDSVLVASYRSQDSSWRYRSHHSTVREYSAYGDHDATSRPKLPNRLGRVGGGV